MSTPHVCPVCAGTGRVLNYGMGGATSTGPTVATCPARHGACVLWEPVDWSRVEIKP